MTEKEIESRENAIRNVKRKISIVTLVGFWSAFLYILIWGITSIFTDVSSEIIVFGDKAISRGFDLLLLTLYNMAIALIAVRIDLGLKRVDWYWMVCSSLIIFGFSLHSQFIQGPSFSKELVFKMIYSCFCSIACIVFVTGIIELIINKNYNHLPKSFHYLLCIYFFLACAFGLGLGIVSGMPSGIFAMFLVCVAGFFGVGVGFCVAMLVYFIVFVVLRHIFKFIALLHKTAFGKE